LEVSEKLLSRTSAIDRGCVLANGNDATRAETTLPLVRN